LERSRIKLAAKKQTDAELVAGILQNYADRGVFRGFSIGSTLAGRSLFKILWHRDRFFNLMLDVPRKTLRFAPVLPEVPAKSAMYKEFKAYLKSRHSTKLPEHRRIDARKAQLSCGNRGGNISVTMTVKNGDFEYATRKLIHAVHEVYMDFLNDGRYYEYMVETFDLDPDKF
jgi:hypothetical protein